MININIKLIFIEKTLSESCSWKKLENEFIKYGTRIMVMEDTEFEKKRIDSCIHQFNCCVIGNTSDFIEAAKSYGYRTLKISEDTLSEMVPQYFLECGRIKPYKVDVDAFIEEDIDTSDINHLESVFSLGNGYLGLRGTYDENDINLMQEPGMYINGIFEKEPLIHLWDCKGFARNEQYTVNLPDWRIIELYIDGEKACFTNGLQNHKRRLDFQKGLLEREFDFTTSTGKTVSVKSIRVVSIENPHSAQIRYIVKPVNFSGEIVISSAVEKATAINGKNPTFVANEEVNNESILIETKTKLTNQTVASAIMHKFSKENYSLDIINEANLYCCKFTVFANENQDIILDKFAVFYSTEDKGMNLIESAQQEVCKNAEKGFCEIQKEQETFWKEYWENADIEIEGNDSDQQAIRLSLFHLRNQLPSINDASIGATGLTGANYSGKVFWDTEMYLMPYYLFTYPQTCKGLLKYRTKLLDKARERAREMGACGALYSWCSIDGEETSVVFEASTAEYHINSDIAYAIWRYYQATEDSDFVYENCAEMLFETAKFMAHRGTFVEAYDGRFCINAVCGPDEYACGVNNNCYTNFMVQFHLRFALSIYKEMQNMAPELLGKINDRVKLTDEELDLWQRAADKMYYRINDRYGIYEQDDRFVYNDAVDMNTIPRNFDIRMMFHPLDLWRIQVLKQADVVLLQFILGNLFTKEEKKCNYDYYEPKTNHGSSLSAAIHSIMANEIGYHEDAYEYFRSSAYMDIGDFKKNTHGGIHIACHGGVWMSVVNGFLGMRLYTEGLEFNPNIPEIWTKCRTKFAYKGAVVDIIAEQNKTTYKLVSGEKMMFKANGKSVELTKAEPVFTI